MVRQIETRMKKLEAAQQAIDADDPHGIDAKFGLSKMNDTELRLFGRWLNLQILANPETIPEKRKEIEAEIERENEEVRRHVLENREPERAATIADNLAYYERVADNVANHGGKWPKWWGPHWEELAEAWGILVSADLQTK